eukprot:358478-Chlamydomonas_euryale.AAC.13
MATAGGGTKCSHAMCKRMCKSRPAPVQHALACRCGEDIWTSETRLPISGLAFSRWCHAEHPWQWGRKVETLVLYSPRRLEVGGQEAGRGAARELLAHLHAVFAREEERLVAVRLSSHRRPAAARSLRARRRADAARRKRDDGRLLGDAELQTVARQHKLDGRQQLPSAHEERQVLLRLCGRARQRHVVDAVRRRRLGRVQPPLGRRRERLALKQAIVHARPLLVRAVADDRRKAACRDHLADMLALFTLLGHDFHIGKRELALGGARASTGRVAARDLYVGDRGDG